MARPTPQQRDPIEQELAEAGPAVMLLIDRDLWEVLRLEAAARGVSAGIVLSDLVERGLTSPEAKAAIARLRSNRAA